MGSLNNISIRKSVIALASVAALAGCATPGVGLSTIGFGGVKVNGYKLSQATNESYRVGQFQTMPRIKTQADLAALDALNEKYVGMMKKAAASGDNEAYAVARHLAAKTMGYRLFINAGSASALASMQAAGINKIKLRPGAYAMLPAFDRISSAEKVASGLHDRYWTMTADASDIIKGVSTMVDTVSRMQDMSLTRPKSLLESIPEGVPYTGVNEAGQPFVVERSKDMFILHNPGKEPVQLDAERLGYVPRLAAPDAVRRKAAPILFNIQRLGHAEFKRIQGAKRVYAQAPNLIIAGNRQIHLDENGNEAQTAEDAKRGAIAYKNLPEYRLAISLWDDRVYGLKERVQFTQACAGVPGARSTMHMSEGQYAEVVGLSCNDSQTVPLYQKTYFSTGEGMIQTWASVVKDNATREQAKRALALNAAGELMLSVAPVYGNFDSAARCATGSSITSRTMKVADPSLAAADLAAFVGLSDDPSMFDKALDCLGAVPLVGSAAGAAANTSRLAKLDIGKLKQIEQSLQLFDTNLVSGKKWAESAETISQFKNQNAVKVAKVFYETAQADNQIQQVDTATSLITL